MSNRWSILFLSLLVCCRWRETVTLATAAKVQLFSSLCPPTPVARPTSLCLMSHDVHHLSAWPSMLIGTGTFLCCWCFWIYTANDFRTGNRYSIFFLSWGFFFWGGGVCNLNWLDQVMMERSHTLFVVTSFHVVFRLSNTSSLLTRATCPRTGHLILRVKKKTHTESLFFFSTFSNAFF